MPRIWKYVQKYESSSHPHHVIIGKHLAYGGFIMKSPLIARFMGPTWGPPGADRTQVGPMEAMWTLLSWPFFMVNTVAKVWLVDKYIFLRISLLVPSFIFLNHAESVGLMVSLCYYLFPCQVSVSHVCCFEATLAVRSLKNSIPLY